jgi:hypothetical protein
MPNFRLKIAALMLLICATVMLRAADDPKPTPEYTISIEVQAVKPQTFAKPMKFFVDKVIDRSGDPQPMLMFKPRGGVFIDREPTAIVREAFEKSLKEAALLAPDKTSATFVLDVYVFHFGLGSGSGMEFFGKVDLNVVVKDPASGKSQTVTAMGTSIQGTAIRKKNILKNIEENVEGALQDALRNFLRGAKLRDAIAAMPTAEPSAAPASDPAVTPAATPVAAPSGNNQ